MTGQETGCSAPGGGTTGQRNEMLMKCENRRDGDGTSAIRLWKTTVEGRSVASRPNPVVPPSNGGRLSGNYLLDGFVAAHQFSAVFKSMV